jgi:1,6-anhydro-N-acetylmuramate kinase
VSLAAELSTVAAAATEHAEDGEALTGVIAAEPAGGERVYVCSFERDGRLSWLALGSSGSPIADRALVRDAVSIAALCELAEQNAFAGDLAELRSRLVTLRVTEAPAGVEEAEAAALELERTLAAQPRVASAAYLDAVGLAARRLEQALGGAGSPFAEAMQQAVAVAEELAADVESSYKRPLE